ncbi:hypothetical protein GCM10010170_031400 [Dactylosporangium salmoneum]|uniref:Uncharacterized protein n=1 Tax=Dactylosporangium salmoneum TaxID=53361 RepID=A0ABP5T6P5_9ACTN
MPGDTSLASFSVSHDDATIVPMVQAALAVNPAIRVNLTSWSAPARGRPGQLSKHPDQLGVLVRGARCSPGALDAGQTRVLSRTTRE